MLYHGIHVGGYNEVPQRIATELLRFTMRNSIRYIFNTNDMPFRWTTSPEPIPDILVMEKFPRTAETTFEPKFIIDPINEVGTIRNFARYLQQPSMDICTGEF